MRRDLTILGIAALLVCAYLAAGHFIARDSRPDETQIRALVRTGERAVERHNLGEIMDCISEDYKDSNGLTYAALRMRAAQELRDIPPVKVIGSLLSMRLGGETAVARYRVTVQGERETIFSSVLSLDLKKEPVWRYLIFRAEAWKVTAVEGYPSYIE